MGSPKTAAHSLVQRVLVGLQFRVQRLALAEPSLVRLLAQVMTLAAVLLARASHLFPVSRMRLVRRCPLRHCLAPILLSMLRRTRGALILLRLVSPLAQRLLVRVAVLAVQQLPPVQRSRLPQLLRQVQSWAHSSAWAQALVEALLLAERLWEPPPLWVPSPPSSVQPAGALPAKTERTSVRRDHHPFA